MNFKNAIIGLVTFLFISCENSNNNPLVGAWELEGSSWNGEKMELLLDNFLHQYFPTVCQVFWLNWKRNLPLVL